MAKGATSRQVELAEGRHCTPRPDSHSGHTTSLRHVVNVPKTSLLLVVAVLPVTVVLSMTTVPPASRSSPPPIPVPESPVAPVVPGKTWPAVPLGLPPAPAWAIPGVPPDPPGPALAWLAVIKFVALDCLEPFF